jgi:hypothetical protein
MCVVRQVPGDVVEIKKKNEKIKKVWLVRCQGTWWKSSLDTVCQVHESGGETVWCVCVAEASM